MFASPAPVADRGRGRKKNQTEGWVSRQLIPTLSESSIIHFPVTVEFRDRPDLLLCMPEDSAGIEITEVVPESYAQAVAIRNQDYPNAIVDRSIFTWGESYTAKQIHRHLSTVGEGHGDVGSKLKSGSPETRLTPSVLITTQKRRPSKCKTPPPRTGNGV